MLAVLIVVAGCYRGHWTLHVRNESGQTWLVRVSDRGAYEGTHWVRRVGQSAAGPTISWQGERENQIEVLSIACAPVGVFRTDDGVTYYVDEVPGLTGTIERFTSTVAEGVEGTDDCGGFLFR